MWEWLKKRTVLERWLIPLSLGGLVAVIAFACGAGCWIAWLSFTFAASGKLLDTLATSSFPDTVNREKAKIHREYCMSEIGNLHNYVQTQNHRAIGYCLEKIELCLDKICSNCHDKIAIKAQLKIDRGTVGGYKVSVRTSLNNEGTAPVNYTELQGTIQEIYVRLSEI
ncbi:MAG: hypothetical protein ABJC12_09740 [Saprospiraceae bacterium]